MSIQLFFSPEDEREFSGLVRAGFPEAVFVEVGREFSPSPRHCEALDACSGILLAIWNRALHPRWPDEKAAASGATRDFDVLHYVRCERRGYRADAGQELDVLLSGSLGWGGGDPRDAKQIEMRRFATEVLNLAESMRAATLLPMGYRLDQARPGGVDFYVVGPAAARWCSSGKNRAFKTSAGKHLYTLYPTNIPCE